MTATQKLNTGRSSQFADSAGGSSNGVVLDFTDINYTGGLEGISSGTYVDVTGVTIAFNLAVAGTVQFFASATSFANPFVQGNYIGIGINVNGTDYAGAGPGPQSFNAAGGGTLVSSGFTSGEAISFHLALDLPAGAYTVKLRALGSGYIASSADFPTKLTAIYPTLAGSIAAAASLVKQEVQKTDADFTTSSDTFVTVPGLSLNVVLDAPQVVDLYAIFGLVFSSGNMNGQIGLRVTSPGPVSTDYAGGYVFHAAPDATDNDTVSIRRVLALGAGTHTVEVLARRFSPVATTIVDVDGVPAMLTAMYNSPQEIAPAAGLPITKQEAEDTTSGTLTNGAATGTYADLGVTTVNINLSSPQVVYFTGQAYGFNAAGFEINVQLGLNVDGVDYHGGQAGSQNLGLGLSVGLTVTKAILLGAGAHTAKLRFRRYDGSPPAARVSVTATNPARLTAIYTTPQALAPAPFAFMETAARTAGDVTGVSSTSLIDVPGPVEVTIDTVGGDVLIEVSGFASGGSSNRVIGLGLKIDGVEQSDTPSSSEVGISPMGCLGATIFGFLGFKWLATGLTPGVHTFRLTHAVSGGSDAILRATPQRPLRMFVWYN